MKRERRKKKWKIDKNSRTKEKRGGFCDSSSSSSTPSIKHARF